MTGKERMLTALAGNKPDKLPVTIHQWQEYHLKTYMNSKTELEAFAYFGMDAAATLYPSYERIPTPDWKETVTTCAKDGICVEDYHVQTPKGELTYQISRNCYTSWYSQHMIKKPEDIFLYRDFYPHMRLRRKELEEHYRLLGDAGIARCGVPNFQAGCYQAAQVLYGTENLIFASYDDPAWVHEFLNILLQRRLEYITEQLIYAKADLVETGGGGASDTVISPQMHKEFCLPYDKKMHDAIHAVGLPVVYHTCGGMKHLLDIIPQNGCDASETLSPGTIGGNIEPQDREAVKQRLGKKVALIGGMNQINLLTEGTPAQIKKEVQHLFATFGKDGGYIMSACDHFFEAPQENLKAYVTAARECCY